MYDGTGSPIFVESERRRDCVMQSSVLFFISLAWSLACSSLSASKVRLFIQYPVSSFTAQIASYVTMFLLSGLFFLRICVV